MFEYRNVGGRLLRCGYTTGTCAAAAAQAATMMLLRGAPVETASIRLPGGERFTLNVQQPKLCADFSACAVQKNSGDDPDVTDGMLIFARVSKTEQGICIDGGEGIGRVTKPGLDQPVGAAAINTIPRQMIASSVQEACRMCEYSGGISVLIVAPEGEARAKRTFNARLGIMGGISIIGTTGIVEPMSNKAMVDTIRLELRQLSAQGLKAVLLTPGNYGEAFAAEKLGLSLRAQIACSNFIGDTIDAAVELGFVRILLIGHIGKLVKLGIGMTNTHSSNGDGRIETLLACALEAGAALELLQRIHDCVSTDAALALLFGAGLLHQTMNILGVRLETSLSRRVPANVEIGYLCFTNAEDFGGILAQSDNAEDLMLLWRENV